MTSQKLDIICSNTHSESLICTKYENIENIKIRHYIKKKINNINNVP